MITSDKDNTVAFFGIRGRDRSSPIFMIPIDRCYEAMNVDWFGSSLGRRRGGAVSLSTTGGTAFSSGIYSLIRHVPSGDQGAAEMWGVDGAGLVKRLTAGTAWANVTLDDAVVDNYQHSAGVSLNGKLYLVYDSTVNRLHVWDPADGKVRRVGVACGSTGPTTAVAGAGVITDTRTYKVQFLVQSGGVTIRQSNLTPASAGQAYAAQNGTITRPTTPATEGITHWRCFAASTDGAYRLIVDNIAIATTTATDNFASLTGVPPSDSGAYTPPPSAKYVVADDTRIIMGGAWETAAGDAMSPYAYRVWWTSRLGASDIGDDERISNTSVIKSYDDVEEAITGISSPINGSFYVFSYDGQWKFTATGNVLAPYTRIRVAGGQGCVNHKSIVLAKDEDGDPALYWWSKNGPVRITKYGEQTLDRDVSDYVTAQNLDATLVVCHSIYHADLKQVWFHLAGSSSDNYGTYRLVFDTRLGRLVPGEGVRGGWSIAQGTATACICSCMFQETIGNPMGRRLKPYVGTPSATTKILRCDTTDLTDDGTAFVAYLESRPYSPWGLLNHGGVPDDVLLMAVNSASGDVNVGILVDESTISSGLYVNLSDQAFSVATSTSVFSRVGVSYSHMNSFRIRVQDGLVVAAWNLHGVIVPWVNEGGL